MESTAGIIRICKELFGKGIHTTPDMFAALNRRNISYNVRSVRATMSRLRKSANLKSSRGRPGIISPIVERIFDEGRGVTTVAGVILHLQNIGVDFSTKTVRTMVQALRKQYNIVGAQNERSSNEEAEPAQPNAGNPN